MPTVQFRRPANEVNAAPAHLLRRADVQQLMQESPHNRGGAGRIPTSDSEELSMINAVAPRAQAGEPYTAADLWVHYLEAANSTFISDRNMFLGESTLRNIARDATAGFAFMNSHRTGSYSNKNAELPLGRSFCGRYENYADEGSDEATNRKRVLVGIYMLRGEKPNGDSGPSTDSIHNAIDAGTLFDCSVGLHGGETICDVCGHDLWEYDPDQGWLCPHVPGTHYRMSEEQRVAQEARGVPGGVATFSLENAGCGEVSGVYDGAVTGAGFAKAAQFARDGILPEESLAELRNAYACFGAAASVLFSVPDKTAGKIADLPPAVSEDSRQPTAADSGTGEAMLKKRFASHSLAAGAVLAALGITDLTAFAATPPKPKAGDGEQPTLTPGKALVFDKSGEVYVADWPAAASSAEPTALSPETEERIKNLEKIVNDQAKDNEKLQNDLAAEKAGRQLAADKASIEDLKRQFKITPAQGDTLAKLAEENPAAFAAALPTFQAGSPISALAGNSASATTKLSSAEGDGGETEFAQLDKLAKEYQKEHAGVSYSDAFSAVCRENKDLALAYREAASGG